MTKWARIENGIAAEVTDIDPAGRFHPSLIWVQCPDQVEHGWGYDNGVFTAPPPRPLTTAQDLAPGRTLEGLTAEEVASFEALAQLINSNLDALHQATEV